jgi:hypothetical protein
MRKIILLSVLIPAIYIYPQVKEIESLSYFKQGNFEFNFSTNLGVGFSSTTRTDKNYSKITAHLWLFTGIPATVGESVRDRYESEYPDDAYWESIKKFSRFPQGI